ncbi:radical SAM domain protein, coenzyme PQQ synthesis protein E, partial [Candidatus Poribacteria bacterium]|nr:radical SAM domain protein, coenzyme PQQ synthesis protein E [Candidatus Poribacteria bacterium]
FATLWKGAKVFQDLRNRKLLAGKCGACEFRDVCGGCRARAYALTGNYLAQDPSCEYQPGQYGNRAVRFEKMTPFAAEPDYELRWTDEAKQRLNRVPSFARGMVTKSVEKYARENGYREITPELMKAVKERFDKTGIPSFRPRR